MIFTIQCNTAYRSFHIFTVTYYVLLDLPIMMYVVHFLNYSKYNFCFVIITSVPLYVVSGMHGVYIQYVCTVYHIRITLNLVNL